MQGNILLELNVEAVALQLRNFGLQTVDVSHLRQRNDQFLPVVARLCFYSFPHQNFVTDFKVKNMTLILNLPSALGPLDDAEPHLFLGQVLDIISVDVLLLKRLLRQAPYSSMELVVVVIDALFQSISQLVLIAAPVELFVVFVNN